MFASDRFTGGVRKRVSLQVGDMHVCWCSFWYNFQGIYVVDGHCVYIFFPFFDTFTSVVSGPNTLTSRHAKYKVYAD